MVVPYSPGGTTDYAARQLAQKLAEITGTAFVVDNRSGASGTIGTQQAARAPADGATFLVTDTTYAMLPLMYAKLSWDHQSDLTHITNIIETPVIAIVPAQSPFQTLQELIAYAKANPGKLNFGSGGPASSTHLAAEMFNSAAQVSIAHIPYRGAGAALADVMAGRIDLLITASPTAIPPIQGARVRALAVSGNARSPMLPNVPSAAEAGQPDFQAQGWFALMAPAKTPQAIVTRIQQDVHTALTNADTQKTLAAQGSSASPSTPAELAEKIRTEAAMWQTVVSRRNLKNK